MRGMPAPTGQVPESIAQPWHELVSPQYLEHMRAHNRVRVLEIERSRAWSNVKTSVRIVLTLLVVPVFALVASLVYGSAVASVIAAFGAWFGASLTTVALLVFKQGKIAGEVDEARAAAQTLDNDASRDMRILPAEPETKETPEAAPTTEAVAQGASQ